MHLSDASGLTEADIYALNRRVGGDAKIRPDGMMHSGIGVSFYC